MTDPKIPVTEDELHAYVDNELPGERRGDVEAWLAAHAGDAERVASGRTMARRRRRLDRAWRGRVPLDVQELYGGCAGCAPAVCRRGSPSSRGARRRARASAGLADQALRLGRSRARA